MKTNARSATRQADGSSSYVVDGASGLPLAFVGTYPPRRCGIATFTRDLADAVAKPTDNGSDDPRADRSGRIARVSEQVSYEIRQSARGDYARAAELVNYSEVKLVSIQHEYGIFGGEDGAYVLDFLQALHVPAIATLHTVLKSPSPRQKAIVQKMASSALIWS